MQPRLEWQNNQPLTHPQPWEYFAKECLELSVYRMLNAADILLLEL